MNKKYIYNVVLIKVDPSLKSLNFDEINGYCSRLPKKGYNFLMWNNGVQFGEKVVNIDSIKSLFKLDNNTYRFDTTDETYVVEVLDKQVMEN